MNKSQAIEAIRSGQQIELRESPRLDPPRTPAACSLDSDGNLVVRLTHERNPVPAPESDNYGVRNTPEQDARDADEYVDWACGRR